MPQPDPDAIARKYGALMPPPASGAADADAVAAKYGALGIGPMFPKGNQPATLPDVTNEDLAAAGKKALGYLPAVGATAGVILAPGGFLPAIAAAALGGAAGSTVQQGFEGFPHGAVGTAQEAGAEGLRQGAYEVGGRVLAKPLTWLASKFMPRRLYQSAVKPSTTLKVAERNRVLDTGLNEGIPASEAGYEKLTSAIDDLNGQIADKIAAKSQDIGSVIDPRAITARLEALEEFYAKQVNADADLKAVQAVKKNFLEKHSYQAPYTKIRPGTEETTGSFVPVGTGKTTVYEPMTLAEAQAEKQATYVMNRKKYGQLSAAQDEAEKNLARGLKEEIVALFPEVSALNARDSSLIALEQQLRRFVGREGNKNVVGLIPAILGTGTGLATGHGVEGGAAGAMMSAAIFALDNPGIKTTLAIALRKAGQSRIGRAAQGFTPERVLPAGVRVVLPADSGLTRVPGTPATWEEYKRKTGFGQ